MWKGGRARPACGLAPGAGCLGFEARAAYGNLLLTSLKKAREVFILSEYFCSRSRLKTVVRFSSCLGLPSPEDMTMSTAKTSFTSKVASLT